MTEMNLIEQLGGYEAAKAHIRELVSDYDEGVTEKTKLYDFQFSVGQVEQALLEYRRQHNSYEVGDFVVMVDGEKKNHYSSVYPVLSVCGDYLITIIFGDVDAHCSCFRHATDAEIEAGKRLEVNHGPSN